METKIASYQEPDIRLQLVKITDFTYDVGAVKYQIRINRKIVYTTTYIEDAKQKMKQYIYKYLNQTEINYEY